MLNPYGEPRRGRRGSLPQCRTYGTRRPVQAEHILDNLRREWIARREIKTDSALSDSVDRFTVGAIQVVMREWLVQVDGCVEPIGTHLVKLIFLDREPMVSETLNPPLARIVVCETGRYRAEVDQKHEDKRTDSRRDQVGAEDEEVQHHSDGESNAHRTE